MTWQGHRSSKRERAVLPFIRFDDWAKIGQIRTYISSPPGVSHFRISNAGMCRAVLHRPESSSFADRLVLFFAGKTDGERLICFLEIDEL